ncbi:3-hydroxyisobutyryl-CoA hydrolase 1 [Datura stramonium]|uniref:3-hydroxyisobutyryl-CoA hydrolase n=1 Tax=Datura stramonium TaxID=4076 RepID=A0ABS8UQU7_DATST|nr:3-hydroxyisobutyryl-CoA hydrolase 1 [Datura stramonium]
MANFLYSLAGEYAGLTGSRLDGAEMLACGLATHFVSSEKLPLLEQALVKVNTSDPDAISAIISRFSHIPNLKEESPYHKMKIINRCFSRRTIEEVISALIREGRRQGVGSCLVLEYRMACHVLKGEFSKDILEVEYVIFRPPILLHYTRLTLDFYCRMQAMLIDKNRNPKWEPSRLELISEEDVDRYFFKIDDEDWEDLKLPPRSNLPPYAIAKL